MPDSPFMEICTVFPLDSAEPMRSFGLPAIDLLPNGELLCTAITTIAGLPYEERSYQVVGALSADGGRSWGPVFTIMEGLGLGWGDPSIMVVGDRVTVISSATRDNWQALHRTLWMARTSLDNGRTWGEYVEFPVLDHHWVCGNLDNALMLRNGTILRPYSYDVILERFEQTTVEWEMVCRSSLLASTDGGLSWEGRGEVFLGDPIARPAVNDTLDEPTVVELTDGSLWMLMRTLNRNMHAAISRDEGRTWEPPFETPFQTVGAPAALHRLSWEPNTIILLWNSSPLGRWPLDVAISEDDCRTWCCQRTIAVHPELSRYQVSYPSVTSLPDGTAVAVWQDIDCEAEVTTDWQAITRCARFNEAWIREGCAERA